MKLDFWQFCLERETIRLKKESGQLAPYTNNSILRVNHFTNVNRAHDRGTIFITDKLCDISDEKLKMLWVFIYRFSGSNQRLFNYLDLSTISSLSNIPPEMPKYYSGAYSRPCFPKGKGIGILFLIKYLPNMFDQLYGIISKFDKISMLDAGMIITKTIASHDNWRNMRFHCGEIAKDLSIFFPQYVNPESECMIGKGAVIALRLLELKNKQSSIVKLVNSEQNELSLNYNSIEHALCEYGKYNSIYVSGLDRKNRQRGDK